MNASGVFEILDNVLIKYHGNDRAVSVPIGVRAINEKAFIECDSIVSLELPESITYLGYYSFAWCTNLERINLPSSIQRMGSYLFQGCHKLKFIYLNSTTIFSIINTRLKTIAALSYASYYLEGSYDDEVRECYKRYIKSQRKRLISQNKDNTALFSYLCNEKIIPFDEIEKYLYFDLEVTVKAILLEYKRAMSTPENIAKLERDNNRKFEIAFGATPTVTEAKKEWNFYYNHKGLYTITSYRGVETSLIIPGKIGKTEVSDIGHYDFQGYKGLITLTISGEIKRIGDSAFRGCVNLLNVIFCEGVEEIGFGSFDHCISLESVTVPGTVNSIHKGAFSHCDKLTFYVTAGSCAEEYAKSNGIKIVYLTERDINRRKGKRIEI